MVTTHEGTSKVVHSMTHVLDLYDRLSSATDDRSRARIIADAFAELELRYPHLSDLATRTHLFETELRLQKEIELVKFQVEQVRADLSIQIEKSRANILQWSFMFWIAQFAAIMAILLRVWG